MNTCAGQTINAVSNHGGVKIVVECSHDVCDPVEIYFSANEWKALVIQGFAAIAGRGL